MFDRCNEEGRPVRGFGRVVVGETLVAPVGEEGAGLKGGRVVGGHENGGYEGGEGREVGVGVGEGEEVGCTVEDFVVDAAGCQGLV